MNWLTSFTSLPTDVLKAIGGVLAGVVVGVSTYVLGRLKEPKVKLPEAGARMALSPEDRDLAYTLARTGTDLTRALHDHGELLSRLAPPAPRPTRARRVTRPRPERPQP